MSDCATSTATLAGGAATGSTRQPAAALDRRVEWAITAAVFAAALIFLWPLRDFLAFNADEGITLASADRILHGQLPYRDFFTFLTPGAPYMMALAFKIFGSSYLVARSVLWIYAGVFAAITYRLGRRIGGRTAALFAAGLLVFGCMPSRFLALHNWDSTLFALLAVCCAHGWLERPGLGWPFGLGCATTLTILTEQSKGAGVILGLGIAAVALWLAHPGIRIRLRDLAAGAAGFVLPLAVVLGYFAARHAAGAMFAAWLWPLRHYSAVNRLPFGAPPMSADEFRGLFTSGAWGVRGFVLLFSAPMVLLPAFAVMVAGATLYAIVFRWKVLRCKAAGCAAPDSANPSAQALDARILGGSIFVGVLAAVLATHRADFNHMLYLSPLFLYLLPSVFAIEIGGARLFRRSAPMAAGVVLLSFLGFGLITVLKAESAGTKIRTRRGTVRAAYADEALGYLDQYVPAGSHLYIHPYQALYGFLSATANPASVPFLFPGFNTPGQYASVIAELVADRTPYVLLNPDFSDKLAATWPATPAEALAADPVETYILGHYRFCRVLNTTPQATWRFYFMVRADLPCPSG